MLSGRVVLECFQYLGFERIATHHGRRSLGGRGLGVISGLKPFQLRMRQLTTMDMHSAKLGAAM